MENTKNLKNAKGQIVSGEFAKILIRKKNKDNVEIGELLVAKIDDNTKLILQVFDMQYGAQISQQNLELVSGLMLEEGRTEELFDKDIRTYILVSVKPLIAINGNKATLCKTLPRFLSLTRQIETSDVSFMKTPKKPLYLGKLRSGSKVLDTDIILDGKKVFSHHLLIPATTGRGKSNLTSVILWKQIDKDYCGVLVLDPHDEYYGRNGVGLKDHPEKKRVIYYTPSKVPVGGRTLKINIESIKPSHFIGVIRMSDPQNQAMYAYYKQYKQKWIEAIVLERPLNLNFHEETLNVLKRRMVSILGIDSNKDGIYSNGVFDTNSGKTTISDICDELENSNTVIIDTSHFAGSIEILIGSLIASEMFLRYKRYKMKGTLDDKPVVSIVLEEAPRVLGKEALEGGNNIFSTIAREGRKFQVGLTAITQLPSMIQRDILANMNTKIILGLELSSERQAIIDSASQDLSTDSRNIASLDIGEAIVTSNFSRFAIPIRIPNFKDIVIETQNELNNKKFPGHDKKIKDVKQHFAGVKLNNP